MLVAFLLPMIKVQDKSCSRRMPPICGVTQIRRQDEAETLTVQTERAHVSKLIVLMHAQSKTHAERGEDAFPFCDTIYATDSTRLKDTYLKYRSGKFVLKN